MKENKKTAEQLYKELYNTIKEMELSELEKFSEMVNLYFSARNNSDNVFFIMDGSITGESEPQIFQNKV